MKTICNILEPYESASLTYSIPRRLSGSSTVNIQISPMSSLGVETYYLMWDESKKIWELLQQTKSVRKFRAKSSNTTGGGWKINYTNFVEITISSGSLSPYVVFNFNVFNLTTKPINHLKAK